MINRCCYPLPAFGASLLVGLALTANARAQTNVDAHPTAVKSQAAVPAPATATVSSPPPTNATVPASAEHCETHGPAQAAPVELPAVESHPRPEQHRRRGLQLALQQLRHERERKSVLLPWLVGGVGVAVAIVGLGIGAGTALTCKGSCTTSFWPGWLIIGGTTMGTAGLVWAELKRRDIAELESRRYQLEQELQMLEWNTAVNAASRQQPSIRLAWHGTF